MAIAGQVIENPITGERFTFIQTSRQTGGESLVFDCRVTPGKARLAPHVHARQEERFEVISGRLGVMLGGKRQVLEAGQRIVLPAGVKHQWWNAGDDEVYFRVTVLPARNLETVLEVLATMAHAGKLNKRGMPKDPFHLANIGRLGETYLPGVPIWMQKIGLGVGSSIGRVLGYDPTFARYRSEEIQGAAALVEEQAA